MSAPNPTIIPPGSPTENSTGSLNVPELDNNNPPTEEGKTPSSDNQSKSSSVTSNSGNPGSFTSIASDLLNDSEPLNAKQLELNQSQWINQILSENPQYLALREQTLPTTGGHSFANVKQASTVTVPDTINRYQLLELISQHLQAIGMYQTADILARESGHSFQTSNQPWNCTDLHLIVSLALNITNNINESEKGTHRKSKTVQENSQTKKIKSLRRNFAYGFNSSDFDNYDSMLYKEAWDMKPDPTHQYVIESLEEDYFSSPYKEDINTIWEELFDPNLHVVYEPNKPRTYQNVKHASLKRLIVFHATKDVQAIPNSDHEQFFLTIHSITSSRHFLEHLVTLFDCIGIPSKYRSKINRMEIAQMRKNIINLIKRWTAFHGLFIGKETLKLTEQFFTRILEQSNLSRIGKQATLDTTSESILNESSENQPRSFTLMPPSTFEQQAMALTPVDKDEYYDDVLDSNEFDDENGILPPIQIELDRWLEECIKTVLRTLPKLEYGSIRGAQSVKSRDDPIINQKNMQLLFHPSLTILGPEPEEVARQITLIYQEKYASIHSLEIIIAILSRHATIQTPTLNEYFKFTDHLTHLVADTFINFIINHQINNTNTSFMAKYSEKSNRKVDWAKVHEAYSRLVEIARRLSILKNYEALAVFVSLLRRPDFLAFGQPTQIQLAELTRMWAETGEDDSKRNEHPSTYEKLIDRVFGTWGSAIPNMHAELKRWKKEKLKNMPDFVDGLINWEKFREISQRCFVLYRFQNQPYNLWKIPQIQKAILRDPILSYDELTDKIIDLFELVNTELKKPI